ncbi:MAG TPA: hypothetical protein VG165_08140 [Solirubrobacteraceae bacterium]|nr:hypothetical protein [Solirubrobacteraceae bacterium]
MRDPAAGEAQTLIESQGLQSPRARSRVRTYARRATRRWRAIVPRVWT